ncbi:MAG: F0F1 ATP synthase subunit B [Patescibacteria group bacterium]
MELLTKLGVDWKLLIAQVINFFILMVVLYKLVYKPVLDLLDKRAKTIEKGVADARESEKRLQEIEKTRQEGMIQTRKEIGRMLDQAKAEADQVKKDLVTAAQAQADDLMRRTKIQIEEEKTKMISDAKHEVGTFIIKATGKLLEREFSQADQSRLSQAIMKEMTFL